MEVCTDAMTISMREEENGSYARPKAAILASRLSWGTALSQRCGAPSCARAVPERSRVLLVSYEGVEYDVGSFRILPKGERGARRMCRPTRAAVVI